MIQRAARFLIVSLVLGVVSCPVHGAMTLIGPKQETDSASWPGTNANVSLESIQEISGPADSDLNALKTAFPGWTFNTGALAALNGTLVITKYSATATATGS